MKAFVPDRAIVPRLLFKSSSSIPIPQSWIVRIFLSSLNVMSIFGLNVRDLYLSSDTVRYLSLSKASEAFETISRRKISLFEYKLWMISFKS